MSEVPLYTYGEYLRIRNKNAAMVLKPGEELVARREMGLEERRP